LVAAQCKVEGNTYATADGKSATFGVRVGDWVPGLFNMGDVTKVTFGSWRQATASRWEATDVGTSAEDADICSLKGQYNLVFSPDCSSLVFSVISDSCGDRADFFKDQSFIMVNVPSLKDCVATTSKLTSVFQSSTASPRLSEEQARWVFGRDEFAIVSVGSQAAIFQRWRLGAGALTATASIVDLASVPEGFACSTSSVGEYDTAWESNCAVRLCGTKDSCEARGQLFHNAAINGFAGNMCAKPIDTPTDSIGSCSPDGRQWLRHPWDCLEQDVPGGCMFCKGIARGQQVSLCLDRLGAECNDIFESAAGRSYCNLEFECPASTASISLFVFISALVAMIFFH